MANETETPIYCRECRHRLYEVMEVQVLVPVGIKEINKTTFSRPDVHLVDADWQGAHWRCGCNEDEDGGPGLPPLLRPREDDG